MGSVKIAPGIDHREECLFGAVRGGAQLSRFRHRNLSPFQFASDNSHIVRLSSLSDRLRLRITAGNALSSLNPEVDSSALTFMESSEFISITSPVDSKWDPSSSLISRPYCP